MIPITSDKVYDWHPNQKVMSTVLKKIAWNCAESLTQICQSQAIELDFLNQQTTTSYSANQKNEKYPLTVQVVGIVLIPEFVTDSRLINKIMNAHSHLLTTIIIGSMSSLRALALFSVRALALFSQSAREKLLPGNKSANYGSFRGKWCARER